MSDDFELEGEDEMEPYSSSGIVYSPLKYTIWIKILECFHQKINVYFRLKKEMQASRMTWG